MFTEIYKKIADYIIKFLQNSTLKKKCMNIVASLILLTIFSIIVFTYLNQKPPDINVNPVTEFPKDYAIKSDELKYILFWTSFFKSSNWNMGLKHRAKQYLESVNCPDTNCVFSHDREMMKLPTDYDAIIFHVGEPVAGEIWNSPEVRNENQIYVMANKESPIYTRRNLEMYDNFFNMTFTYRLDSDVVWSYGNIFDIETKQLVAPSRYAIWRKPEIVTDPKLLNFIQNSKSRSAAWFVSHCNTSSNRDLLVQKLQQFIDVDIYGNCGNLTCPRFTGNCEEMLNSTYKFYLAFENSLCVDYITEKVFQNMQNFVVPIVYNGITDMSNFLPPHSYINVNDFGSVEELADYLKYLDENPQKYANYFWWKKYYKIIFRPDVQAFCQMCVKINEWSRQGKKQEYPKMANWYNHKTCFEVRQELAGKIK